MNVDHPLSRMNDDCNERYNEWSFTIDTWYIMDYQPAFTIIGSVLQRATNDSCGWIINMEGSQLFIILGLL